MLFRSAAINLRICLCLCVLWPICNVSCQECDDYAWSDEPLDLTCRLGRTLACIVLHCMARTFVVTFIQNFKVSIFLPYPNFDFTVQRILVSTSPKKASTLTCLGPQVFFFLISIFIFTNATYSNSRDIRTPVLVCFHPSRPQRLKDLSYVVTLNSQPVQSRSLST